MSTGSLFTVYPSSHIFTCLLLLQGKRAVGDGVEETVAGLSLAQFGSPKIQKWHCRGARKLAGFDCMYAQCLKPSVLAGGGSQISLPSRLPTQWGGTVPPRRAMLPPPPTLGRWAGEPEQVKAKPHQSIDFLSVCSAACVFAVFSMTGHNLSQIGNRS